MNRRLRVVIQSNALTGDLPLVVAAELLVRLRYVHC
jgi:hypothetical protein